MRRSPVARSADTPRPCEASRIGTARESVGAPNNAQLLQEARCAFGPTS
jgi:hypothetical protein